MVDNEETRREGRNEEKKYVMEIQRDIGFIYEKRDRGEYTRIEGDWKTLLYPDLDFNLSHLIYLIFTNFPNDLDFDLELDLRIAVKRKV